jgi:hypothetical protein
MLNMIFNLTDDDRDANRIHDEWENKYTEMENEKRKLNYIKYAKEDTKKNKNLDIGNFFNNY